jgi:DNA-directed RNA polymerase subunit RPC12/RpoP
MKNFIVINEEFVCKNCGQENSKLKGSCRNHCTACLFSLHVDKDIPGDRQSECHSLMSPTKVEHNGKKGWMISHECKKCGKIIKNKAASDDDFDQIIKLS